jgi:hypothetical protein
MWHSGLLCEHCLLTRNENDGGVTKGVVVTAGASSADDQQFGAGDHGVSAYLRSCRGRFRDGSRRVVCLVSRTAVGLCLAYSVRALLNVTLSEPDRHIRGDHIPFLCRTQRVITIFKIK